MKVSSISVRSAVLLMAVMCMLYILTQGCSQEAAQAEETPTVPAAVTRTPDVNSSPTPAVPMTAPPAMPIISATPLSPTVTLVPTTAATPEISLGPATILLAGYGNTQFYLIDLETGAGRFLWDYVHVHAFLGWEKNGCELIVSNDEGEISQIDLRGRVVRKWFSIETLRPPADGSIFNSMLDISPDKQWVTYWVGKGKTVDNYTGRPEFVDLYLIPRDKTTGANKISRLGGVDVVAWSTGGDWLAYDDYDLTHTNQLFVLDMKTGKNTQITNLAQSANEIYGMAWSQNKPWLAVNMSGELGGRWSSMVVDIESGEILANWPGAGIMAWFEDQVLIYGAFQNEPERVYLANAATGEIERSVPALSGEHGAFYLVGPFKPQGVFGFIGTTFWTIDLQGGSDETKEWIAIYEAYPAYDIGYWVSTPDGFRGEASCE